MKKYLLIFLCMILAVTNVTATGISPAEESFELLKSSMSDGGEEWSFVGSFDNETAIINNNQQAEIIWTSPKSTVIKASLSAFAESVNEKVNIKLYIDNIPVNIKEYELSSAKKNMTADVKLRIDEGQSLKLVLSSVAENTVKADIEISEVRIGLIPDKMYNGSWEMFSDYKNTDLKGINDENNQLIWGDSYGNDRTWEFYFDKKGVLGEISEVSANQKWQRKEEGAPTNQLGDMLLNTDGQNAYQSRGHYDNVTVWNSPVNSVVSINADVYMNNAKTNRQTHFEFYKNDELITSFVMIGTEEENVSKAVTEYICVEKGDKVISRIYVTDKNGNETDDSIKGNSYLLAYSIKESTDIQLDLEPVFTISDEKVTADVSVYNPSGASRSALFILTGYSENGALVSTVSKTVTVESGNIANDKLELVLEKPCDDVKLFMWDGYKNMRPYYKIIQPGE